MVSKIQKMLPMWMIAHKLVIMMMKMNIAILGSGRMGQAIQDCVERSADLRLAGCWSRTKRSDELPAILSRADVVVDFTLPDATEEVIRATVEANIPLVCGVSGLTESTHQQLLDAAGKIPILYDRNMSLGIAVLQRMIQMAGAVLGDQFEAEIHETHHVHKIDAPSGTALQLGEALAAARGQAFADVFHYDPENKSLPKDGQISFKAERRGEVPGEHTVVLKNASESLVLEHKVIDRRVFAEGALEAARWLAGQSPGFYSMQDVVGR